MVGRSISCPTDNFLVLSPWHSSTEVDSRLTHHARLSIDDGSTSNNSTNLALKAIFGIQAMSEVSRLLSKESDFQQYNVRRTFWLHVT